MAGSCTRGPSRSAPTCWVRSTPRRRRPAPTWLRSRLSCASATATPKRGRTPLPRQLGAAAAPTEPCRLSLAVGGGRPRQGLSGSIRHQCCITTPVARSGRPRRTQLDSLWQQWQVATDDEIPGCCTGRAHRRPSTRLHVLLLLLQAPVGSSQAVVCRTRQPAGSTPGRAQGRWSSLKAARRGAPKRDSDAAAPAEGSV
jgi:hypothetical protein